MSWLYNIYLKNEQSEPVPTTEAEHNSINQKEKKFFFPNHLWNKAPSNVYIP